jgi:hypothetical protein
MAHMAAPIVESSASAPAAESVTSPVTIQQVNPLDFGGELKTFMSEEGHPEFGALFDRGYEAAVRDGAMCWFGRDPSGRLVMSITAFAHAFRYRERTVKAAVLGNFMTAHSHRTFFPSFALMNRVLRDVPKTGRFDLLYGDPNASASAIMKAVRLTHVDDLDRMVLPIADADWARNFAARLYTAFIRVRAGRVAHATLLPLTDRVLPQFAVPVGRADRLLPYHRGSALRRRLSGFPGNEDHLVELRLDRTSPTWDALVLLRGPDSLGIVQMVAVQRSPLLEMRAIVPALAPIARRLGGRRLQIDPLSKGGFARECARAGLVRRENGGHIFARAFTDAGVEALSDLESWELTSTDMER